MEEHACEQLVLRYGPGLQIRAITQKVNNQDADPGGCSQLPNFGLAHGLNKDVAFSKLCPY